MFICILLRREGGFGIFYLWFLKQPGYLIVAIALIGAEIYGIELLNCWAIMETNQIDSPSNAAENENLMFMCGVLYLIDLFLPISFLAGS